MYNETVYELQKALQHANQKVYEASFNYGKELTLKKFWRLAAVGLGIAFVVKDWKVEELKMKLEKEEA